MSESMSTIKSLVVVFPIAFSIALQSCATMTIGTAIDKDNIEQARKILAKGDVNINETYRWVINPSTTVYTCDLVKAVRVGDGEMIKLLLTSGANPNGTEDSSVTPLYAAIFESRIARREKGRAPRAYDFGIVRLLMDKGADVNKPIRGTKFLVSGGAGLNNPFFMAGRSMGMYLNVDGYFPEGSTPLHIAAMWADYAVKPLLEKGANIKARNAYGWTPLHLAARTDGTANMEILIDHGADINVMDDIGQTPLMMAAESGHVNAVKMLVARGADINLKSNKGKTAQDFAMEKGKKEVEAILTPR